MKEILPLLEQAHRYAEAYIGSVRDRPVFPSAAAIENLSAFDGPMPEQGLPPAQMLERLHTIGGPATVAQTGGRYFGFVNGGLHPPALAARWLADSWDQNAALHVMSPIASKLEAVCETWLASLLGLPKGTAVGFVSGTSTSLTCGFAAARNTLLQRQNWDVAADGLFGAPEIKVVLGEQAHGSVFKALAFLGLGKDRVHKVPCDHQGRMLADQVPDLDEHTLLVLAAGNVNSGAFDPCRSLCEQAKAAGAWVHIDGAFGLWAAASPKTRYLTEGIELADSWSVDAHKTLNAPYDSGIILCRDRDALASALHATGSYLQFSEKRDNMMYAPEMSRRARGIDLWATLVTLGQEGLAGLIDQLCDGANLFAEGLQKNGFRILNDVVFNQVLVTCDTPAETEETLKILQSSGECWCGGSVWFDEPVIRISVCAAETTQQDIERSVAAFVQSRQTARSLQSA